MMQRAFKLERASRDGSAIRRCKFSLPAVAVFYLLAGTTFIGCRRGPEGPPAPPSAPRAATIVLVGPPETDPISAAVVGGALKAAAGFPGIVAEAVTPVASTAPAIEAAVNAALVGKPAAVGLWVDESQIGAGSIDRILAARVPLVTLGTRPAREAVGQVAIDWAGAAALLGERLPEALGDRRSYVLIHEDGHSPLASSVYASFRSAARRHFSLALLDERKAPGAEAAREAIRKSLDRFRHAGLVVTLAPDAWLAAGGEFALANGPRFITLSTAPPLWPRLRNGEAAALAGPVAGEVGKAAMELMLKAALGELDDEVVRYVPCELVTPETLDDFAARYAAAGDLDPRTMRPVREQALPLPE
jgi:ABC-type sugar transport system substrate-binding protein